MFKPCTAEKLAWPEPDPKGSGSSSFLGLVRCGELGIGPLKPKLFAIDLAYQAGLYEVRTIAGNQNPTVNGRYDSMVHVGSLSLRFNY